MTEGKQDTEFESLLVKASNLESQIEIYDVADESFSLYQEDIGFTMTFDKLQDHQKQVAAKGLRFDFLGLIESIEEAIARNNKRYLKLQLQDLHGKTLNLCLFEETAHYCSVSEFTERYLLSEEPSLLFIQSLQWDGKYLSTDRLTIFESGAEHPQATIYKQVEEYLRLKLLPKENNHLELALGISIKQVEELVQKTLAFLELQKEIHDLQQEELLSTFVGKITEIAYAKTYSGTSYLLQGEDQTQITNEYANYFLGQLQSILENVVKSKKQKLLLSEIALHCILERWRREVVSLHEFEKVQIQSNI